MGIEERIRVALRLGKAEPNQPRPGQIVRASPQDTWRDYVADGLTPGRLGSILKAADAGDLQAAMDLYEQMEEKDSHLFSVASTRRLAVTGLPWQVISAADVIDGIDRPLADEAAHYCREVLIRLEDFEEALQHLSLALGRNVAAAELVWDLQGDRHRLVGVVPVPFGRLHADDLGRLRIAMNQDPAQEAGSLPANKFIVHMPQAMSGHPARGGLLRVTAMAFLGKHYALKDWLVFSEVFGMPVRIARYEPQASPAEKRELLEMLKNLGADAVGIFSKAVDLEIKETIKPAGSTPYETLCNFLNREISKAWLGQTLTTDTAGSTGTFSTASIHERVREDLRDDDIRKEGRTIRRHLLRPLVQLKFGLAVPVPFFRRSLEAPRDIEGLARVLTVAINQLGLKVPARWAHDALGIPASESGEASVPGAGTAGNVTI
jgi:phage gp29-like protein